MILRAEYCFLKKLMSENRASAFCLNVVKNFAIMSLVLLIKLLLVKKACTRMSHKEDSTTHVCIGLFGS